MSEITIKKFENSQIYSHFNMGESNPVESIEVVPCQKSKTVFIGLSENETALSYTAFVEISKIEARKMAKAILSMCDEMD